MKRFPVIMVPLAAAVLLTAGCINTMDVIEAPDDETLIMNAMMTTGETNHIVYLTQSDGNSFRGINKAPVKCYVNDVLVADAVRNSYYDTYHCSAYVFNAVFEPGDNVRIEVGDSLSAEAVVPEAPVIRKVTASMVDSPSGSSQSRMMLGVTVQDVPDVKNYYRIRLDGYTQTTIGGLSGDSPDMYIYSDEEPLLKTYKTGDDDSEDLLEELNENKYNLFSDNSFSGESYTLKIGFYPYLDMSGYFFTDEWASSFGNMDGSASASVTVTIFSMSKDTFSYIKSCEASWNLEDMPFVDPMIFPQNVDGGNGYVSVSSAATYVLEFPEKSAPATGGIMTGD
jgi:hypothetical protein